jgi:predicted nuclease of predicted toxin-antitoxin system
VRLLADENQHPHVVAQLRANGYDVEWVRDTSPGAQDAQILLRADIETLTLITDDRDFGDLIFNKGYPAPYAILYNRLNRAHPDQVAVRLLALLKAGAMAGHIITITKDGERMKPFPFGDANA